MYWEVWKILNLKEKMSDRNFICMDRYEISISNFLFFVFYDVDQQ